MKELILLFTKLGVTGFGGPVALIGYMEEECVRRRHWLSASEFHKTVAVAKLFPGPLATLIAVRIGCMRAGNWGGFFAGFCLIFPAFLMVLGLSHALDLMDRYSNLNPLWTGLNLGALAVSFKAVWQLSRPLVYPRQLRISVLITLIGINAVFTYLDPRHEVLFLIASGTLGIVFQRILNTKGMKEAFTPLLGLLVFYACIKASFFTYGSGIAIVPMLKAAFVDQHHWIREQDFLRGLTLGQITPGPLIIISTYLGFVMGQTQGAMIATLGTFMPTFILGIFVAPTAERKLLQNETVHLFFKWMLPAVSGAILGSLIRLSQFSVQMEWSRIMILVVLIALVFKSKTHSLVILLTGGFLALLFQIA